MLLPWINRLSVCGCRYASTCFVAWLDGDLLRYREHGTLLDHLIVFEQMISKYNDWVLLTKEAQTMGRRSPGEVAQVQHTAGEMANMISILRGKILALIGISES